MNPQRTSHGLGLEPVAADWPALHEADIEQLLVGYPQLGPLHSLHWHSLGRFPPRG